MRIKLRGTLFLDQLIAREIWSDFIIGFAGSGGNENWFNFIFLFYPTRV